MKIECVPLIANFEFCIECDKVTAFNEDPAMCCICGSHHPLGDWYDEAIPPEHWETLKDEVLHLAPFTPLNNPPPTKAHSRVLKTNYMKAEEKVEDLLLYNYRFRPAIGLGIWKDSYNRKDHGIEGYQYYILIGCLIVTFSRLKPHTTH